MTDHIEHILRSLPAAKAPPGLAERIAHSITELQERRARIRAGYALVMSAGCVAALFATGRLAAESASASGLATYLTLMLSDTRTMASSWYEFLQLIVETLPLAELSIATAILFALTVSLRALSRNMRVALHTLTPHAAQ